MSTVPCLGLGSPFCEMRLTSSPPKSRQPCHSKTVNLKVWLKKTNKELVDQLGWSEITTMPPSWPSSNHISHIKLVLKIRGGGGLREASKRIPSNLSLAALSSPSRDKHIVSIRPAFSFLILKLSSATL